MSLCDRCKAPGRCCRSMRLFGHGLESPEMSDEDAVAILQGLGLPFVPYARGVGGAPLFTCPKLGNDGRCTDYENRPDTCRNYEPGSTPLCAHYGGDDASS